MSTYKYFSIKYYYYNILVIICEAIGNILIIWILLFVLLIFLSLEKALFFRQIIIN